MQRQRLEKAQQIKDRPVPTGSRSLVPTIHA